MNEELRKQYFSHFGFKVRSNKYAFDFAKVEKIEDLNEKNSLLEAIYALNPVTKLPTGDIACYLSSKTSPEVKKFVLDNIMMDTSSAALPSIPDGIDDETVFALSRQLGEDLDSYMNRLNAYTQQQVELRDTMIEDAKNQASKNSEVVRESAV